MTEYTDPDPNVAPAGAHKAGTRAPDWVSCGTCKARWTGLSACHCSGCHKTYTSISAFDKHRTGSHVTGRSCLTPQEAGLVQTTKRYWSGWSLPGERPPQDEM